jgi:Do/DeqQ family serine protease
MAACQAPTATAVSVSPLPGAEAAGGVPTLAPLLKRITPAVVNIAVRARIAIDNPLRDDPFFRRFFDIPDRPLQRETHAAGSDVIVDAANGYVLTNSHVVEHADVIDVTTKDKRRFRARLIGRDPDTDVAVLKIEPNGLTAIELGDSDRLQVGDYVVAIGNPFGLGQTVTSGIVSALGRTGLNIEGYEDFIQTDAPINPGNSGGALVDLTGRLVGINTAILAPGGGSVGIGFAVPVSMARGVMDQLIRYGEIKRGVIGVSIQDLTPDLAGALNVQNSGGALVAGVEPTSAAEKAGMRKGDVVIAMDGVPVTTATQLRNRIGLKRVGSQAELTVLRDGTERTLRVRIDPGQVRSRSDEE